MLCLDVKKAGIKAPALILPQTISDQQCRQ